MPATSVDEYLLTFDDPVKSRLLEIRSMLKGLLPEANETINYGIPTFKLNGNLVHFAGYKKHVGFYPGPSGINAFEHRLKDYKVSKGSVQFPNDKPLPLDLIVEIVQFRVAEQTKLK